MVLLSAGCRFLVRLVSGYDQTNRDPRLINKLFNSTRLKSYKYKSIIMIKVKQSYLLYDVTLQAITPVGIAEMQDLTQQERYHVKCYSRWIGKRRRDELNLDRNRSNQFISSIRLR